MGITGMNPGSCTWLDEPPNNALAHIADMFVRQLEKEWCSVADRTMLRDTILELAPLQEKSVLSEAGAIHFRRLQNAYARRPLPMQMFEAPQNLRRLLGAERVHVSNVGGQEVVDFHALAQTLRGTFDVDYTAEGVVQYVFVPDDPPEIIRPESVVYDTPANTILAEQLHMKDARFCAGDWGSVGTKQNAINDACLQQGGCEETPIIAQYTAVSGATEYVIDVTMLGDEQTISVREVGK